MSLTGNRINVPYQPMHISQQAVEHLVKASEGYSLVAFPDPATGGEPWTIGYGHAIGVNKGDTCTEEQATEWLMSDLAFAESKVTSCITVSLKQYQFDALVDLFYNEGPGQLVHSHLVFKINNSDFYGASEEFLKWIYADNKIMQGLVNRRFLEALWFNGIFPAGVIL